MVLNTKILTCSILLLAFSRANSLLAEAHAFNPQMWNGLWATEYGVIELHHRSGNLKGTYGKERHPLHGVVSKTDPSIVTGTWEEHNARGRFQFQLTATNEFKGTWSINEDDPRESSSTWNGKRAGQEAPRTAPSPTKEVTIELIWLLESNDENRAAYVGPGVASLQKAGYGRMVRAGDLSAAVSIGKRTSLTGSSRYGTMQMIASLLNTTSANEVQVDIELDLKATSSSKLNTTVRVPVGRWLKLSSSASRVATPKFEQGAARAVVIMRVNQGLQLLD